MVSTLPWPMELADKTLKSRGFQVSDDDGQDSFDHDSIDPKSLVWNCWRLKTRSENVVGDLKPLSNHRDSVHRVEQLHVFLE